MLYGDKRETYRDIFFQVWQKYQQKQPLDGIETVILPVLTMHPEYQAVLENPDRYADRDYTPEAGETNPFLHMGLHVSIAEQLAIDQPPGIRALYDQARAHFGEAHAAEHLLMDCLAETIWQMQRQGSDFDTHLYTRCIRAQIGLPPDNTEDKS